MARWRFMAVVTVAVSILLWSVRVEGSGRDGPSSMEFYVHNPGLFTAFPAPPVQQQLAMKGRERSFKSRIITFDNVITAGGSTEESPVLGRAHGIRVVDVVGDGPLAFTWLFTASFNASSSGFSGTLSFQGTTLNFPSSEFSDVTVTGGTGTFRFARGYATFTNFYKADEISSLEGQHFQVFLRY